MEKGTVQSPDVVRIEPHGSWPALNLRELWAYRELLYFLAWRDVKIRYKQTLIGVFWAVLQPVLMTLVFTIIFSLWGGLKTETVPYPLFALSGLIIWLFTFSTVTFASNSLVGNSNLVTKVYFPRLIVPFAATLAGLFDLIFSVLILIGLMAYYFVVPTAQMLLAPIFVILAIIQTAAVGTLLCAINVRFRDVRFGLPFLLQVWMVASPIFYPANLVPAKWKLVFALNPMTGILEGFRGSLFGGPFDWQVIGVSSIVIMAVTILAVFIFKGMEDSFADQI